MRTLVFFDWSVGSPQMSLQRSLVAHNQAAFLTSEALGRRVSVRYVSLQYASFLSIARTARSALG